MSSRTIVEDALPDAVEFDDIVRRAREGERAAFVEIMDRYEGKALMIARGMGASRHDAEDIVQDVFIKLFRYIGSYRSGRSFVNWFYRIVVNAARDHMRRLNRAGETVGDDDALAAMAGDDRGSVGSGHGASEAAEDLRRAMAVLTEREREVVILRDLQGLTAWEVSRILRISPITVRRHASLAHERLKKYFAGKKDD